MPTIKPIPLEPVNATIDFQNVYRVQWTLAAGDTAEPAALARFADRAIQVSGTFGGATVTIKGSLDGITYAVLRDGEGLDLSTIADSRIKYVQEPTAYLKPEITGGDGTTAVVITIMATRGGGL